MDYQRDKIIMKILTSLKIVEYIYRDFQNGLIKSENLIYKIILTLQIQN
jgi:hypothetical protein